MVMVNLASTHKVRLFSREVHQVIIDHTITFMRIAKLNCYQNDMCFPS